MKYERAEKHRAVATTVVPAKRWCFGKRMREIFLQRFLHLTKLLAPSILHMQDVDKKYVGKFWMCPHKSVEYCIMKYIIGISQRYTDIKRITSYIHFMLKVKLSYAKRVAVW